MNAKYIGCSSFKSKKGTDCYVVSYALFNDGVFLRCCQDFVSATEYDFCVDTLNFGESLEVRTYINQFGSPAIGLIYE